MNAEQLAYWIQGMLEYTNVSELSEADLRLKLQGIKDHTALVFKKVTPPVVIDAIPKRQTPSPSDNEKHFKRIMDQMKKDKEDKERRQGPTPWYSPSIPTIDPSTWKTSPLAPPPYNLPLPYTSPYYMLGDYPGVNYEAGKTVIMC